MMTRAMIDSRRLFYFYKVAKAGSFTVAETYLGVAQSALTRQIQQLEKEVGLPLLQRNGRGVTLTESGEILLRHAEDILGGMSAALSEIEANRCNPSGRLAVAAPTMFSRIYMPEVVRVLVNKFPNLRLVVTEVSTEQVQDYLASGKVDAAVVVIPPSTRKCSITRIAAEPLHLITHADHPLANARWIEPDAIAGLEMIVPASTRGSRLLIERYLAENGVDVDFRLEVDSLQVAKGLIAQGPRFCTLFPALAYRDEIRAGIFRAIPLRPQLIRTMYLARLRLRPETPYFTALADAIAATVPACIDDSSSN